MQVSWKWLSRWVDTSGVDPLAFAQQFTCTVAEIDAVHRWGFGLREVLVADVVAVAPHPNADKLRLATVDLGGRRVQVVCGAPDLRVGLRVPFVPPGVTLPSGITVRDGEVRGVSSPGMLASEADLGLSDDHAGLLALDGVDAPAGTPLPDAVELEDVLYEVDNKSITHRPDLWGQYGMAREVAAMLDRPLQPLDTAVAVGQGAPLDVQVQTPLCPRYVCARIDGVRVAPSPVSQRLLLRRLGVRPISNVVDATNLVMLETGNPLHAFDARHVRGGQIRVRHAAAGEQIATLDGQVRTLVTSDLVIADGQGPVALAGVMGGGDSEIRADTETVVLEAAAFDAATVRKTAMRLGMRTESSARFEKALDPTLAGVAARRFLQTLLGLSAGARVASDLLDVGAFVSAPPPPRVIATSASYLRARLGLDPAALDDAWMVACLQRLGFAVQVQGDQLAVTVPSWRATKDIRHAEDLVEELGRHYGYQRIPSAAPLIAARPPYTPPHKRAERQIRAALVLQRGLTEVLLYGFDHEGHRARLGLHEGGLPRTGVRNTLSSEHSALRRNLGPNLIAAVEQNLLRGDGREAPREGLQVALFELGRVFVPVPAGSLGEAERQAIDHGVPALALAPADTDARQAWFGLMDAEMAGAIDKTVASGRTLPWQPQRLGIAVGERLGGGAEGNKRVDPARSVSQRVFAEAVAAVQAAAAALGKGEVRVVRDEVVDGGVALPDRDVSWRHPARGGWLVGSHGQRIGHVALLHPDVRNALDVACEMAVAELNLDALLASPDAPLSGAAPARHPSATVDLTVTVPARLRQAVVCDHVHRAVVARGLPLSGVRYLYEYQGAAGARSLTLRLTCRAADRTLSATELDAVLQAAQAACVALLAERP